jgi:hypothetical protein
MAGQLTVTGNGGLRTTAISEILSGGCGGFDFIGKQLKTGGLFSTFPLSRVRGFDDLMVRLSAIVGFSFAVYCTQERRSPGYRC